MARRTALKKDELVHRELKWLGLSGLALCVWFIASSIHKPVTTDEVEFSGAILGIVRTGVPMYYGGEVPERYRAPKNRWMEEVAPRPDFQYGLWHPPLYIYWAALSAKLFGVNNWALRLPGALLYLGTLLLLYRVLRMILPAVKAGPAFAVGAFLYLINPLLIQQALMLDLDNTVVAFTSVLYLHEFLRLDRDRVPWVTKYGWVTVIVALTFWAKEFAALYLTAAACAYVLLQRRWKEAAGVMVSLVAGAALFWATWWLYCKLCGLPVMYFVRFTILGKLAAGEGLLTTIVQQAGWSNAITSIIFGLFNITVWSSPFYWCLLLLFVGWRVGVRWKNKSPEPLDLLLFYVAVVLVATQIYRPSGWFLKYSYPAHAVMTMLFGVYVLERLADINLENWRLVVILSLVAAVAQVQVLGDPVFSLYNMKMKGMADLQYWSFYLGAGAALAILLKLIRRHWSVATAVTGALVIGLVAANLGLDWKQRAPYVTSISWNNYGEMGFAETAAHLQSVLGQGQLPICRKDFGFYLSKDETSLRRPFYHPFVITDVKTAPELVENITATNISHIVLDRYSIRRDTLPIIQQYYALDRQIGSFYVLRRVR